MKVLLDTHAVLWAVLQPALLSQTARQVIQDADVVYVSAATACEIAAKVRLGRLPGAAAFEREFEEVVVDEAQYTLLPIETDVALRAGRLPGARKDPFDRMIAAQALKLDAPVISKDGQLDAFGVRRLW